MAAKRLTLGQKCIGNGSKIFIIGLQKNQTKRRLDNCRLRYCGFRLWVYALNLLSNKLAFKMAANRLTLGQKCIGNQLKIFVLGLQKVHLDENLITVG